MTDSPNAFRESRVLITGGAGFIGSNLARRLLNLGATVTVVDNMNPAQGANRRNLEGVSGNLDVIARDIRDEALMKRLVVKADVVFNLAGQTSHKDSMEFPAEDFAVNAEAQMRLMEICRRENPQVRVVFASTRQVYGRPRYLPLDEEHPLTPVDVNGINKIAAESYHLLYQEVYGIPTTVLRLTNTYGPRMRIKDARQTFVGVWIRQLLEGRPIQVWGGTQLRDFTYADDCVDAMLLAGRNDAAIGGAFNLGGTETMSLVELAKTLVDVAGSGSYEVREYPADRKKIEIGNVYSSSDRFTQATGWRPRVAIREGLTRTVDYYRQYLTDYL